MSLQNLSVLTNVTLPAYPDYLQDNYYDDVDGGGVGAGEDAEVSENSIDRFHGGGGHYGHKKVKSGHSNIYVFPPSGHGHGGGHGYNGLMDKFFFKMEGMMDKYHSSHSSSYHETSYHKKDDGLSLSPLLLTLPLLFGLGALYFANRNGSNTVVNVNVNTTQNNNNGRSFFPSDTPSFLDHLDDSAVEETLMLRPELAEDAVTTFVDWDETEDYNFFARGRKLLWQS